MDSPGLKHGNGLVNIQQHKANGTDSPNRSSPSRSESVSPTGRRRDPVGPKDSRNTYEKPRGVAVDNTDKVSDDDGDRGMHRRGGAQQVISFSKGDESGGKLNASSYDAVVRKVSFIGPPYVYDRLAIKPLIPFFKHLARPPTGSAKQQRSSAGRLAVLIPDVIVYGEGEGPVWYYSSADGHVFRTDTFSEKHILKRFGNAESDTDLVAVLKRANFENTAGNEITLLDSKDLRTIVSNPPTGTYCIQKYVRCKGPKAFISRCVWKAGSPSYAWVISNRYNFDENVEADFKYRYCTCTEVRDGTTIFRQTGRAVEETELLNIEIVTYLERTLQPRVRFAELVADYLKDEDGRWWLLQVKAFQLDAASLPAQLSLTASADDAGDDESDDADADAAGAQGPTDYTRTTKCRSCLAGYNPAELSYSMTMKMILETEDHLKRRGKYLRWFDRPEMKGMLHDPYIHYRSFAVCKNCYDLFLTEQKLIAVERAFARATGVPQDPSPAAAAASGGLETGFVARDDNERRKMATRDVNHKIPRGVPVKLQDNPGLKPIPPVLTVYRLLTYFHELQEFPDELAHFQRDYYLEYTIFNYTTRMRATVEPGYSSVPIHKLRVFHFVGNQDSLRSLLEVQQRIEVSLYTAQRRLVGTTSLPLRQFVSGIIEKLDLFQLFGTKDLGMCRLKVTLGIVKGDEINTALHTLHIYQGVYLPPPTFFTADPLPKEWIELVPSQERQRKLKPSQTPLGASLASRDLHGSGRWMSSSSSSAAAAAAAAAAATATSSSSALDPPSRVFVASADRDVVQVWAATVDLHAAHDLQLSNKDSWHCEYKAFKRRVFEDNIVPKSITAPLIINHSGVTYLRASYNMLLDYFAMYSSIEVSLGCKSRSGTVGRAVLPVRPVDGGEVAFGVRMFGSEGTEDILQAQTASKACPWLSYCVSVTLVDPYSLASDCVLLPSGLPSVVKVDEPLAFGIERLAAASDDAEAGDQDQNSNDDDDDDYDDDDEDDLNDVVLDQVDEDVLKRGVPTTREGLGEGSSSDESAQSIYDEA